MTVKELAEKLGFRILTRQDDLDKAVTDAYCGDLLSWVMSHAAKGDAWITVHTHVNIVAVAVLAEISCIIIPEKIQVEEATIKKANSQGVTILGSDLTAYEICWRIHEVLG